MFSRIGFVSMPEDSFFFHVNGVAVFCHSEFVFSIIFLSEVRVNV